MSEAGKTASTTMSAGNARPRAYWRRRYLVMLAELLLLIGYLLVMAFGGSAWLHGLAAARIANRYALIAAYLLCFLALFGAVRFPLGFYGAFWLEHRFGLSNQRFRAWLWREAKSAALSVALLTLFLELVYELLRRFPAGWWILAAGAWIALGVVLAKLGPVLIMPLFYKSKPLEAESVCRRIRALAEGTGLRVEGVYEFDLSRDTKKANAALAGLGRTRRVLLADTLLREFSEDEIAVISAHEIGHHVRRHIWKGLGVAAVGAAVGLWLVHVAGSAWAAGLGFRGLEQIAAFPVFALVLLGFVLVTMPLQNALSRMMERTSDGYAIQRTGRPGAFISAMEKLAKLNLADPDPHPLIEFMLYSHPPIRKRIAAARLRHGTCESRGLGVRDSFLAHMGEPQIFSWNRASGSL